MLRVFAIVVMMLLPCTAAAAQNWFEEPVPIDELRNWRQTWIEREQPPAWVERPEPKFGEFVFVTSVRARTVKRAFRDACSKANDNVQDLLLEHLEPAFGTAMTLELVAKLRDGCRLVDVVTYPCEHEPKKHVAALCWSTPLMPVLEAFDARHRSRIEWALTQPFARSQLVEKPPAWTVDVPARAGRFRIVCSAGAKTIQKAQTQVLCSGRASMRAAMFELLAPILGAARAETAITAGLDRMFAVRRVHVTALGENFGVPVQPVAAWTMWELPIRNVLLATPEVQREAVRAALQQTRR